MKKIVLAALLGGLVVFVWGAFSHMALPLGEMGMSSLPNEEPVLSVLRNSVPNQGLYFFPGMESHNMSAPERAAWEAKYRTGPAGLLIYRPVGGELLMPRMMIVELLTNMLAALLAALIITRLRATYFQRVMVVGSLGLFAWISISLSYWNWYDFPGLFVFAEGIDQVVGWLLGGLVISKLTPAS